MSKRVINLYLSLGVYVQHCTDYYPVLVTLLPIYVYSLTDGHNAHKTLYHVLPNTVGHFF